VPTANAGADVKIRIDKTGITPAAVISLDGRLSSDPEGGTLTYTWAAPSGGALTGSGATPTFTATSPGVYPVSLVVSDGVNISASDVMTVTVYDLISANPLPFSGQDAQAIEGASDGGLYLLGTIAETPGSLLTDIYIQKINPLGNPTGQLSIEYPNSLDLPSDLIEIEPGIVAVVGTVADAPGSLNGDVYLAVVNLTGVGSGTIQPPVQFSRAGDDLVTSIRKTDAGDLLVSGSSVTVSGERVMRFIRLAATSYETIWDILIDAPGTADYGIDAIEDGNTIVILGDTVTTSTQDDIYLARVEVPTTGNPVVTQPNLISGAGTDVSLALEKTATGFLVVGSSNSFGAGGYDILAIRTGSDLQVVGVGDLADYAIGGGRDDFSVYARKVTALPTGFLITGATQPVDNATDPDFDAVLLFLNADGNLIDQGVYAFAGASDEIGVFTRELPVGGTYQLAGIRGILDFISPAEFSISSGGFFTVNIDKLTMLVK
jgi:PKD repeat protein